MIRPRFLSEEKKLWVVRRYQEDGLTAWGVARELGDEWGQADIYNIVRKTCKKYGISRKYRHLSFGRKWVCGHPRTLENSVAGKFKYGCRICRKEKSRQKYYQSVGYETAPMPISYRYAMQPIKRKYRAIRNKVLGVRVVEILNRQEAIDRASYILLEIYKYDPAEVARHFGCQPDEMKTRALGVRREIEKTEHQDMYKDWSLVQQLIDEGCSEAEVKEMICISDSGWNIAKREGRVRV